MTPFYHVSPTTSSVSLFLFVPQKRRSDSLRLTLNGLTCHD